MEFFSFWYDVQFMAFDRGFLLNVFMNIGTATGNFTLVFVNGIRHVEFT